MKIALNELSADVAELLRAKASEWTVEEIETGVRLAAAYAELLERDSNGEEVASDLRHARSGIASLRSGAASNGASVVNSVIEVAIAGLTKALLPV